MNDKEGYEEDALNVFGINKKLGDGSGFVIKDDGALVIIKDPTFPTGIPDSGGNRNDLCTCNCKAGNDGIGCVGWGA